MKKQWKTAFYFTASERNGIVALAFFCTALLVIPTLFRYWQPEKGADFAIWEEWIADTLQSATPAPAAASLFYFNPNTLPADSFRLLGLKERTANAIVRYRDKGGRFFKPGDFAKIYNLSSEDFKRLAPYIRLSAKTYPAKDAQRPPVQLAFFDPNLVSFGQLQAMGVPAKTAHIWINFLKKGGVFRQPEDLKKIYGLSLQQYERLAPWVRLSPAAPPASFVSNTKTVAKAPQRIDINQASAADWELLDGIGPAYARRITSFRDKLGGFVSVDQVAETRGLPDSVFQRIKPWLDGSPIFQTIPINTADEAALNAHPYLNSREAKAIVSYRNQHGPFKHPDELRKLHALSAETLQKILPYLRL